MTGTFRKQVNRTAGVSHQRSSSYTVEVVEEALGVVDGWTKGGVWFTPLAIQILTVQIAASPEETHNREDSISIVSAFVQPI